MTSDPATASIGRILDDMRNALVTGNLDALAVLAADLAQGMEATGPVDPNQAHEIRAKAARNLACLDAASRGVRSARRRLDEIRKAASGAVVSYDGQGRRSETSPEAPPRQRL